MRDPNPDSLRERKKQRTREAIADAALELFAARGFDAVTVAEVAAAAEVSEKTVFNHFPSKEQLVFDLDGVIEAQLVALVKERAPGVSVVQALRALGSDEPAQPGDRRRRPGRGGHNPHWDEHAHLAARQARAAEGQQKLREVLRQKLDFLDDLERLGRKGPAGRIEAKVRAELRALASGGDDEGAAAVATPTDALARMRAIVQASPALQSYRSAMFSRYEDKLREALLEEIDPADSRARAEVYVFAAGVVGVLRLQLDAGGAGEATPRGAHSLISKGLSALERGFRGWRPGRR